MAERDPVLGPTDMNGRYVHVADDATPTNYGLVELIDSSKPASRDNVRDDGGILKELENAGSVPIFSKRDGSGQGYVGVWVFKVR